MKKRIVIPVLLSFFYFSSGAQNTYYDALQISRLYKQFNCLTNCPNSYIQGNDSSTFKKCDKTIDEIFNILKYYVPADKRNSRKSIASNIKYTCNNPFLSELIEVPTENNAQKQIPKGVQQIVSSISGFNVTSFADGMAQFMIERAKGEITVAFIEQFKIQMEKNPEIQVLFPNTADMFQNMLSYEYSLFLPTLQKVFQQDMANMFYNVGDIFELPEYREILINNPGLSLILQSMYTIAKIGDGTHPADVLDEITKLEGWKKNKLPEIKNLEATLKLSNIISASLRFYNTTDTLIDQKAIQVIQTPDSLYKIENREAHTLAKYNHPAWISDQHLKLLYNDTLAFKIFLGLVYQKAYNENIQFIIEGDTINFCQELKKLAPNINQARFIFSRFHRIAQEVDFQKSRIDQMINSGTHPSNQDYYCFVDAGVNILEYGSDLINFFPNEKVRYNMIKSNLYISLLRDVNEFFKASYSKNYTTMVFFGSNVISAMANIIDVKSHELELKTQKMTKNIKPNPDVSTTNYTNNLTRILPVIIRYGTFMAQISEADSGEQVKNIVETFALPVGSSIIKKQQVHNVAVGSYLGMAHINTLDFDNDGSWKLYAPIGVSYTPVAMGKGGSISLFAGVLDIGAVIDYRLKASNDTIRTISGTDTTTTITKGVSYTDKIQLGSILSPSVSVVYGFPWHLPLALGVGAQYKPALSRITDTGNTLEKPEWVFNISLTIDIPIINLYPGRRCK